MLNRTLLAACLLLGAATATFAAEESSNRGDIPTPDARQVRRPVSPPPPPVARPVQPPPVSRPPPPPPQVYRPPPPPPRREVYREPPREYRDYRPFPPPVVYRPAPRLGYTCQTRRFECELRRPRPLGEECECQTPSGSFRPGEVVE